MADQNQIDVLSLNKSLLSHLNKREQDIVTRRFGLSAVKKQTLEQIGRDHNLTRERIRQLESAALKKIAELENLEDHINQTKQVITALLKEYGGLLESKHLLDHLIHFSHTKPNKNEKIYKNNFYFIISKLLKNDLKEVTNSKYLDSHVQLQDESTDHLEEIAKQAFNLVKEEQKVQTTEDLISNIKKAINDELLKEGKEQHFDITSFAEEKTPEKTETILNNKSIYATLVAHKNINQSKLGYWGLSDWSEIRPKTINEKIYLVLKEHKEPMHFTQIAEAINEVGFDKKKANAATVHNELILGDKYVLVGRGMYTLTEWGYKKGTVTEIITDIIKNSDQTPTPREYIIDEVLKQRIVKRTTVILALTNSDKFQKVDKRYTLA